ncbi:MAG TPA: cell division protein ZapA [Bacteroidales bacterium]|jgi:cell division protein ZapA|nr:cell division protein ZapA [Bacteroidales bacterium]HPT08976.1 cell division protein ZapA [Bacteroidales bacterium]
MDELSISVPVAERTYRLAIEKEHEELFRKAAKLIDNRIRDYSASYAYKDKQDLLAMVALEYATSYLQNEQLLSDQETRLEIQLLEMDHLLDEQLKD